MRVTDSFNSSGVESFRQSKEDSLIRDSSLEKVKRQAFESSLESSTGEFNVYTGKRATTSHQEGR